MWRIQLAFLIFCANFIFLFPKIWRRYTWISFFLCFIQEKIARVHGIINEICLFFNLYFMNIWFFFCTFSLTWPHIYGAFWLFQIFCWNLKSFLERWKILCYFPRILRYLRVKCEIVSLFYFVLNFHLFGKFLLLSILLVNAVYLVFHWRNIGNKTCMTSHPTYFSTALINFRNKW